MAAGHWQFLTSRDSSRAEQAATAEQSRSGSSTAEQAAEQAADNSRVEQASEEDFGCLRERETDLMNRLIFFGQQVLW